MKKFVKTSLVLFICICVLSTTVYAITTDMEASNSQTQASEVSQFFINFVSSALSNPDSISITNNAGESVTSTYKQIIVTYYSAKDYESIQSLFENNNPVISHIAKTSIQTPSNHHQLIQNNLACNQSA